MIISKRLIIVIEDEIIIAQNIKEILDDEGFQVMININSIELAIELIKELNPVLVIIDVNLKMDQDGTYIGKFLLNYGKVPFMYLTSYSDNSTIDKIKTTRPYGYINKPYRDIDVVTNVNIIINNFNYRKVDINRRVNEDEIVKDEIPFIIKKSVSYINDNINKNIQINELALQTKWDTFHFSRMFKKYLGLSPYNYILNRKIEIAKTLLIDIDKPIAEIAFELGFDNHSNFSVRFKKFTGHTPDDFRKINRIKKLLGSN